jgi:hypothetical protein
MFKSPFNERKVNKSSHNDKTKENIYQKTNARLKKIRKYKQQIRKLKFHTRAIGATYLGAYLLKPVS